MQTNELEQLILKNLSTNYWLLILNNLQGLICHKTLTNQGVSLISYLLFLKKKKKKKSSFCHQNVLVLKMVKIVWNYIIKVLKVFFFFFFFKITLYFIFQIKHCQSPLIVFLFFFFHKMKENINQNFFFFWLRRKKTPENIQITLFILLRHYFFLYKEFLKVIALHTGWR